MVLRMANAQEVGPNEAPELYGIVQDLAQRGGLPMPRVYIIDEEQPNAFATGRNPENAAVAATTGLLRHLSREEITGVMAHELSHVRHRDTLTMTIAATLSGAIGMLASFGGLMGGGRDENGRPMMNPIAAIAMMIMAPLAASLVQMAISRSREYEADRMGAEMSGQPLWLASALGQAACRHAADPQPGGRGQPGDGASLHRQPAVGRRPARPVLDPSADGGAHRAPRGDGGPDAGLFAAAAADVAERSVGAARAAGTAPRSLGLSLLRTAGFQPAHDRRAEARGWKPAVRKTMTSECSRPSRRSSRTSPSSRPCRRGRCRSRSRAP